MNRWSQKKGIIKLRPNCGLDWIEELRKRLQSSETGSSIPLQSWTAQNSWSQPSDDSERMNSLSSVVQTAGGAPAVVAPC